jgi:hypothetical protein
MLGPKRDITGRGLPVPKSVTLKVCAYEVAAIATKTANDEAIFVQENQRCRKTDLTISD